MRKGSIFGNAENHSDDREKQLIELGLDKKSIENNIIKNKKTSLKEANNLTSKMMEYYAYPLDYDINDQAEFYEEMIRKGANLEYYDEEVGTILHFAISSSKTSMKDKFSPVFLLLENGADCNAVHKESSFRGGSSCLMEAIKEQKHDVFKILMLLGADVNYANENNITALYNAVVKRDTFMAESLLKAGASPNFLCYPLLFKGLEEMEGSISPLMYSVWQTDADMVELLLKYGADVTMTNDIGKVAFDFIDEQEDEYADEIENLLKEATINNKKHDEVKNSLIVQAKNDLNKVMRK